MPTTASAYIPRSPDACWRVFTDPVALPAWVPGLRRARVIATAADGLPLEVLFEFSESLTYSLVYSYDPATREVRWEPRAGKRDGVRGAARFEAFDAGTRVTYTLEQGDGRSASDRAIASPALLVEAFARWMAGARS
ncbi:MAG: SRPBCC family protein [Kofleriaceae bacterium]